MIRTNTLHISGEHVLIVWDDECLSDGIYALFTPWKGVDVPPTYTITVKKAGGSYHLTSPFHTAVCNDPPSVIANLEYALTRVSQHILGSHLQIHAACISLEGEGIVLAGPHGTGKTTLALAAMACGYHVLTDDVSVLDCDGLTVMGFPRPFRVTDSTLRLFPGIIPAECPVYEVTEDLTYVFFYLPEERYYERSVRLASLVFPVRRNGAPLLRKLSELEAVQRLIPQGFNFDGRKEGLLDDLSRLVKGTAPCELQYSNPQDALRLIGDSVHE